MIHVPSDDAASQGISVDGRCSPIAIGSSAFALDWRSGSASVCGARASLTGARARDRSWVVGAVHRTLLEELSRHDWFKRLLRTRWGRVPGPRARFGVTEKLCLRPSSASAVISGFPKMDLSKLRCRPPRAERRRERHREGWLLVTSRTIGSLNCREKNAITCSNAMRVKAMPRSAPHKRTCHRIRPLAETTAGRLHPSGRSCRVHGWGAAIVRFLIHRNPNTLSPRSSRSRDERNSRFALRS
jgi:hypothetical protein